MFERCNAKGRLAAGILLALGAVSTAQAAGFGDMMNPGKWFGGNKSHDDGPYGPDVPPYGYGGGAPYGYGAPPYGAPAYGAPGAGYGAPAYGAPGAGYGAPAYGAPPAGAYGQPVPAAPGYGQVTAVPPSSSDDSAARIRELEQRIQELERTQRGPQQPMGAAPMPYQQVPQYRTGPQSGMSGMSGMPGTGTFRPMGQ